MPDPTSQPITMTLPLVELDDRTAVFRARFIQGNGNERTYWVGVSVGDWTARARPVTVDVTLAWPTP